MPDVIRDISLLVQIARVDATLHGHNVELSQLPARIAKVEHKIALLDEAEAKATEAFESMKKERRALEQGLQDDDARIAKFKNDLMTVKSNKEYTAALKEIETKKEEIGQKEERVLELMDSIEQREATHQDEMTRIAATRDEAVATKGELEAHKQRLEAEVAKATSEKPKLLLEVGDSIRRRYERLLERYGDVAATRIEGECCGGCHTQLPPQVAVEVRKNDHIVTCQECGRILIYYAD